MNAVAQLSAGVSALVLIAVFPLEAFLIDRDRVQTLLGIEPDGIRNVHLWSFCIGARNALAGVGTLIGLWMVNFENESTGTTVVVITCIYMLLASLFMGIADLLGF
jgi:putative membrane protein